MNNNENTKVIQEFILDEAQTALMLARKLEQENELEAAYVYRRYGNKLLNLMSPESTESGSNSFYESKGD